MKNILAWSVSIFHSANLYSCLVILAGDWHFGLFWIKRIILIPFEKVLKVLLFFLLSFFFFFSSNKKLHCRTWHLFDDKNKLRYLFFFLHSIALHFMFHMVFAQLYLNNSNILILILVLLYFPLKYQMFWIFVTVICFIIG